MTTRFDPRPTLPRLLSPAAPAGRLVLGGLARALDDSEVDEQSWQASIQRLATQSHAACLCPIDEVPGLCVYVSEDPQAASRALILERLLTAPPVGGCLVSLPSPDKLMCLRIDGVSNLDSLPVLLAAHRIALRDAAEPLLVELLFTDGQQWELAPGLRGPDGDRLEPGPLFRASLAQLSQHAWMLGSPAVG